MQNPLNNFFLFALALILCPSLNAQADKGMALLDKGNPLVAEAAFRTDLSNPKEAPYAMYGLALVFLDAKFERRQLDSAFAYIEACDRTYRKMPPDLKSKIVKKLSTTMISDLRKQILDLAAIRAKAEGTPEAYDFFLDNYPKPAAKTKKLALTERNALLLQRARATDNWSALQAMLDRYGPSLATDSPAIFIEVQTLLFQCYTRANGLAAFTEFKTSFPDNIVSKDTLKATFDRALQSKAISPLVVFIEHNPGSAFLPFAVDSLAARLSAAGTEEECLRFIRQYPRHPQINPVWQHYYSGIRRKTISAARLEQFRNEFPEFPFPEQIEADITYLNLNQERLEYEVFTQSPSAATGFQLLNRYPASRYREDIIKRTADVLLLKDSRKEDLETFLKKYPLPERRQALLNRLYEMVSKDLNPKEIQTFEQNYPDFADKKRIAADKEKVDWNSMELGVYTEARRSDFEMYIRKTAPSDKAFAALRKMIDADFRRGNFAAAGSVVNAFQKEFGTKNEEYNELRKLLAMQNEDINRQSFAEAINTKGEEYAPILSADGRSLYLCRRGSGGEDIWASHQDADGQWPAPKLVTAWNTGSNSEAPESISADGNEFYLFRSGKFFLSRKTAIGWSAPEQLGPPFNQFRWQADLSIAADGKAILFAAAQVLGAPDIYVSLLQKDGSWGEPFSLGATVNTVKSDRSPFLHPDGKTLYFSSEGHAGIGESDIFMTKRLDDTWTNWSKPVNLGPALNTSGHDWGFRVSTDGQFAYYTAFIDGNSNIVRCNLPQALRPEEVATITGKMLDTEGRPLDAEILWEDLSTGKVVQVTRTNPATGEFFAVLPERSRYGYSVRKPGYFPLAGNVDLRSNLGEIRLEKPMELATIEEMKARDLSLPLNNLFFETSKYDLQPESFPELNRLAQLVIREQLRIEIQGHTDNVGAESNNQILSENRAKSVRDYLIAQGCDGAKIEAKGFGKNRPKASNDNEAGRALNRRVEIRIKS